MTGSELRLKRQAAGIPSGMLAGRLSIARSKLSDVERGYVPVSDSEGARISAAIDELIEARKAVAEVAARVGWPAAAL